MDHFKFKIITRWADMDALNHINHAKYFTYFEQARIAWWYENKIDLSGTSGPVLVKAEAEYLQAVSSPSEIIITLNAHSPGRSSYWIDYSLFKADQLCAKGRTKVVWLDYKKNCSVALPNNMLEII